MVLKEVLKIYQEVILFKLQHIKEENIVSYVLIIKKETKKEESEK